VRPEPRARPEPLARPGPRARPGLPEFRVRPEPTEFRVRREPTARRAMPVCKAPPARRVYGCRRIAQNIRRRLAGAWTSPQTGTGSPRPRKITTFSSPAAISLITQVFISRAASPSAARALYPGRHTSRANRRHRPVRLLRQLRRETGRHGRHHNARGIGRGGPGTGEIATAAGIANDLDGG